MAKQILIADDDPILVEILKFRLEGAGYTVAVAKDGEQALDDARKLLPDLIVLDSMMPIMAGPEVLAELKADADLKQIPVVMLTARDAEADMLAGLKGGASDYLTKPFISHEFLVRIAALIEGR